MSLIFAAPTYAKFVDACTVVLLAGPHCRIDEEVLDQVAERISSLPSFSFDYWLDPTVEGRQEGESVQTWLRRSFLHIAINAALNGGYFEDDGQGGIRQWAVGGSGSRALEAWIRSLVADGIFPGKDIFDPAEAPRILAPTLAGTPHHAWRVDVASAFADADVRERLLAVYDAVWTEGRLDIRLEHADMLAKALPAGFGGDPFRKKAVLALSAVASIAAGAQGGSCQLPIPSDYQIPRILQWLGVIGVSDVLKAAVSSPSMLDVNDDVVTEFRAAAVVACDRLSKRLGIPNWDVDGRLFGAFRKDPNFIASSLPPMRCDSPWF